MKNNLIILIIVTVIVGAGGFFVGMKYQENQRAKFGFGLAFDQSNQQGNQRAGNRIRQGFRPVNGEIIEKDDKSITVKLVDGQTKIAFVNEKTAVRKTQDGSISDLKIGEKVMVMGTDNSDGSMSAQNIQLNPTVRNNMPTGSK